MILICPSVLQMETLKILFLGKVIIRRIDGPFLVFDLLFHVDLSQMNYNINNMYAFYPRQKYEWLADILPRPSTLWIQKAITLFSRFDRDGDGYLSEKDILLYINAFQKHGCLSNERAARMRDKTYSFWTLLNKGAKKVTLEEFVKVRYLLIYLKTNGTSYLNVFNLFCIHYILQL